MKNVQKELARIQASINVVKGQRNSFGKYNYRSCEDIVEAYRGVQGDTSLIMSDDFTNVLDRIYCKATVALQLGEEKIEATAWAREPESQKGMGAGQLSGASSSYARKYALSGLFALDDTKDEDTKDKRDNATQTFDVKHRLQDHLDAIQKRDESLCLDIIKLTPADKKAILSTIDTDSKDWLINLLQK